MIAALIRWSIANRFLVLLATLSTLPPDVYEAARLDRASAWQRFVHITLPLIRPAIMMVVIMRMMTALSAFAAIFAATGQDLGMVGTSSMAHGVGRRVEEGLNVSIRLPGLEVATVGGGTTLPYARSWLALMGCAGSGKVYRLAQIVAAATLALEISASAAMATAGSENFFRAHHERGGLR